MQKAAAMTTANPHSFQRTYCFSVNQSFKAWRNLAGTNRQPYPEVTLEVGKSDSAMRRPTAIANIGGILASQKQSMVEAWGTERGSQ